MPCCVRPNVRPNVHLGVLWAAAHAAAGHKKAPWRGGGGGGWGSGPIAAMARPCGLVRGLWALVSGSPMALHGIPTASYPFGNLSFLHRYCMPTFVHPLRCLRSAQFSRFL
jgi:hypothetical protein